MVKINIRKNERKGYQIDMDTVPAFPVRDMPIALHFVPVQLSRKIGYHCPGEHGLSLQLNCHDQTDTDPSAEGTPPVGIDNGRCNLK